MTHNHSVRLWQGLLRVGTAPDEDTINALVDAGVTHIGCCLRESDITPSFLTCVRTAGLSWTWLPFTENSLTTSSHRHFLRQYLDSVRQLLEEQHAVYLCCDDTKTRCSLLSYALCLKAGMSTSSAYTTVCELSQGAVHSIRREYLRAAGALSDDN